MIRHLRLRRIGWFVLLLVGVIAYALLHIKVTSVQAEVVKAERRIIALEQANLLLETEYLTRSSQVRLTEWNRVDFGFIAPKAEQFITSERQLAQFSSPRIKSAPAPIMLAGMTGEGDVPAFPQLAVSPPAELVDAHLLAASTTLVQGRANGAVLVANAPPAPVRIALTSAVEGVAE